MDDAADDVCDTAALVTIWERWADDTPLLRQVVADIDAGEVARAEQRQRLLAAVKGLVPRRDDPGISAAVCAALAVLCLIGGDLDTDFAAVAAQAIAEDHEAREQAAWHWAQRSRRHLCRTAAVGAAQWLPRATALCRAWAQWR